MQVVAAKLAYYQSSIVLYIYALVVFSVDECGHFNCSNWIYLQIMSFFSNKKNWKTTKIVTAILKEIRISICQLSNFTFSFLYKKHENIELVW